MRVRVRARARARSRVGASLPSRKADGISMTVARPNIQKEQIGAW